MTWETELQTRLKALSPFVPPGGKKNFSSVIAPLGWNPATSRHEILLMKRTLTVETHKGQVCFPGGFHEDHDGDLLQTALRETEEEIGVKPEHLKILGMLSPVQTRDSVEIHPFVAQLDLAYLFQPNPTEVDRLLFLPVRQLLNEGLKTVLLDFHGVQIKSIGISVKKELIWGATARMLQELRQCLQAVPSLVSGDENRSR
jgi:8-oxo-dGTP pyrophosphatase MutT (NUDIX family)